MPLNQSEQNFFDLLARREAENPSKPLEEQSLDEFRQPASMLIEFAGEPATVTTKDRFITARDGCQIPIRIFNADIKTQGSIFIMFPGGGYVMNTFAATAVAASRFEGMRSDSEEYFKKLQKAGCQVSKKLLPGQTHLTMLLRGIITEGEDPAKIIAEILRD